MIDVKKSEKDVFYNFEIGLNTGQVTFVNDVKLSCSFEEYVDKLAEIFNSKKGSLTISSEYNVFSASLSDIAYINVGMQRDLPFTEPMEFDSIDDTRKCDNCVYYAGCLREKDATKCDVYREV